MTILITGATGAVGRSIIDTLLAAGAPVRALTRDPDKAALPERVEAVRGDLSDPSALEATLFAGVDRAFVFPATTGVDMFVQQAVDAGVTSFVVLSSLAAAAEHRRDLGSASHSQHLAIEQAVRTRTENWTILRPGTFDNNLLSWAFAVRSGFPIRAPYLESAQAPIHEADVADVAVTALLDPAAHRQAVYPLTGPEALTRRQQIAAISNAIGREIEAVEITAEAFRTEAGAFISEGIISMLLDYWSDTVTEPDRVRSVQPITGREGRTLAEWARDHRHAFSS
jgi:uncharacterized protein YbjT (DUF2867 family)